MLAPPSAADPFWVKKVPRSLRKRSERRALGPIWVQDGLGWKPCWRFGWKVGKPEIRSGCIGRLDTKSRRTYFSQCKAWWRLGSMLADRGTKQYSHIVFIA